MIAAAALTLGFLAAPALAQLPRLDPSGWSVDASSTVPYSSTENAIDDSTSSNWRSRSGFPVEFFIDLGALMTVDGVNYLSNARLARSGAHANAYEIAVATGDTAPTSEAGWTTVADGSFAESSTAAKVSFAATPGRFVRLTIASSYGASFTNAADIGVFGGDAASPPPEDCGGLREAPCPDGTCTYVPPGGGRSAPNPRGVCVECGISGKPKCTSDPPCNPPLLEGNVRCVTPTTPPPGPDCDTVWEELPDMPAALGEVSSGILSIGGSDNLCVVGQGNGDTYCYDIAAGTWSGNFPERPCEGNHHARVVIDNEMYLVGGLSNNCETVLQKFDGSTWTQLADLPFRSGSGSAGTPDGETITICSGIDGDREFMNQINPDLCATYDIATDSWSIDAGDPLFPSNHAAYCTDGSELVMISGRNGPNTVGTAFDECTTYDMVSQATSDCTDLPYPVGGTGACVNAEGGFWVFGGELNGNQFSEFGSGLAGSKNPNNNLGVVAAVSFFDRGTGEWQRKADMPEAKHGMQPTEGGGYVYVVGGGVDAGFSASATAHRAQLSRLVQCDV